MFGGNRRGGHSPHPAYAPPPGAPAGRGYGGGGGYGVPAGYGAGVPLERARSHRGPPPGADPQLWQWFSSVDADRSGAISATELQSALVNGMCSDLLKVRIYAKQMLLFSKETGPVEFNILLLMYYGVLIRTDELSRF